MTESQTVRCGWTGQLTMRLWLLLGSAIATSVIEPTLAEATPLPEGEPAALESTTAAASLVEPEASIEQFNLDAELNVAIALSAVPQSTSATIAVPHAEIATVMDSLEETTSLTLAENTPEIAQTQPIAITDVQIEETADGFSLRLEADGELTTPATSITGNAAIADIPNATLQLPDSDEFFASSPAEGISLINITNLPNNQIRIAITGTDAPPAVNITTVTTGLTLVVTPGTPTVQPPEDSLQIVVTGEQDGYLVPTASTATRTDTPLRDIPQSIQVIPRQVIEDQQATRLEEVLDDAAGVTLLGNFGGTTTNFAIRGFNNAPVLRDGFRLGARGGATPAELANLERVEVLRGPASILSGQSEPGGIVNLVSKQPLAEPYYNLQFQFGNRAFVNPSLDFSGPLTEDGKLLYRLNALYRQEDSLQDYDTRLNRFFIAPTVSWQIGDRTDLIVNFEYVEDNNPAEFGTVLFGEGDTVIPFDRVINNPDDTIAREYLRAGYTLEHRFSENWQVRNQFSFISDDFDYGVIAIQFALDEATGTLIRGFTDQFIKDDLYSLYTNVQGKFNTGPVAHTLLFGVDWVREESESITRFGFGPGLIGTLNIFNPDYTALPKPDAASIPIAPQSSFNSTDRVGIYIQDQIDILDNLILVAGLRYDTVNQDFTSPVTGVTTNEYNEALTPRIGIVYQPIEPISLYGSYSQSFNPNSGTDAQGQPFDPEEGEGFEVGIKAELLDGQLAATLAYFDITKQNVLTLDPVAVPFAFIATGEQRSRGVDLNITGEILPGWNVVASYAYIDAEVTESNTDTLGNRFSGIPEHSASLWTAYEIQSGDLAGLGFGLGLNYVGERQGDIANSFRLDSYLVANAAAFYRRDNWQLRLNIDNLFDSNYIEAANGAKFRLVQPGRPLTVRASVSYTF